MRRERQNDRVRTRRAVVGLHDAEMQVLRARQRGARRAAMGAINAALSSRHASAIASIVARFADRRAALMEPDQNVRAAALRRIADDEAHELARLALEHAAEKRAIRKSATVAIAVPQRAARRSLRQRNRRQRIVFAVQLQTCAAPRVKAVQRIAQRRIAKTRFPEGIVVRC